MYVNRRSCVDIVSCRHSSRKKGGALPFRGVYRHGRSRRQVDIYLLHTVNNTEN